MSNVVHAVYFGSVSNLYLTSSKEDVIKKYGELEYKCNYAVYFNKFERLFLSAVIPGDYYFFIIAEDQLDKFRQHLDVFGMNKYEVYRSKVPIANLRYGTAPRLNVFMYQFDDKFADKWKEWSSK